MYIHHCLAGIIQALLEPIYTYANSFKLKRKIKSHQSLNTHIPITNVDDSEHGHATRNPHIEI
jgi:hypothetical protein